jgi:hypothetical protein
MNLEYTLTLAHYKAANQLHRRLNLSRRLLPWLGPFVLFLSIAGFVSFSVSHHSELAADSVAFMAGAAVVTIGAPISRAINLRKCFKQLFPPNRADRGSHLEIGDDCIISSVPGVSEGKIFWPGVHAFAQDERVTMIYLAPKRFLFFPTSALSPEQCNQLNQLVDRHRINRKP